MDSQGITNAALQDSLTGIPDGRWGQWQDWETVQVALDALVSGVSWMNGGESRSGRVTPEP